MQYAGFSKTSAPRFRTVERLPDTPLNPDAPRVLSHFCARTWQVCPLDYNGFGNEAILTLAVHNPQQISVMLKRRDFLRQPYEISFVLGRRDQVMRAIEAYYTEDSARSSTT